MGTNLMYMLAPDMMVGWNITPTKLEKKYIQQEFLKYVGLGGWYGKNTTGNVEEIIKRAPDVCFDLGTMDESYISEAERVQGLINTPVIMADGSLVKSGDTLRYIGGLIHREERAEELASYCDDVVKEAQSIAARLSDDQKVRVYYAEGGKGLNTDPSGSEHTEVLDLVGGMNVAQVGTESDYGMAPVSLEQVLAWDPEVILVASDPAEESNVYEQITTGADWSTITAVKNHQVYQIPRGPFDWFDRPPCISRILGIRWLGNLLYPDLYQYDMGAEVTRFYKLFYQIDVTDAQLDELMARATRVQ
jgi:iron complex transport system substrate-binding protein